MVPPKTYKTKVIAKSYLTRDVVELKLELLEPKEIEFTAGQFISVKRINEEGKPISRAYSILNPTSLKNEIHLCIKLVPNGQMSPHMGKLEVSDELEISGPFGTMSLDIEKEEPVCFIATGVGIAPFYAIMHDALDRGCKRKIRLFFGFRYEKDIFYREELDALCEKYPNLTYTIILSRPEDPDYSGEKGRVTDLIENHFDEIKNSEFFICGIGEMVCDSQELLMKKGIAKEFVHSEKYF